MSDQTEMCFCKSCRVETLHVVVLVRKASGFENSKDREHNEFMAGFMKSLFVGAFIASMDEFSRHIICEKCGTTIIEE